MFSPIGVAAVRLEVLRQHAERRGDDPAIDVRHQVVALGRGQELGRRDELVVLVAQPQQELGVRRRLAVAARAAHGLGEQAEAMLGRARDAVRFTHSISPWRSATSLLSGLVDLDAVAARCPSPCSRRRRPADSTAGQRMRTRPATFTTPTLTPTLNDAVLPDEAEVGHRRAQHLRDVQRRPGSAVLEQHAELVAAQPRQRVAFAQPRTQQRARSGAAARRPPRARTCR